MDFVPVTPVSLTLAPAGTDSLTLTASATDSLTFAPIGGVSQPPFGDKKRNNQDFENIKTLYPTFADLKADTS